MKKTLIVMLALVPLCFGARAQVTQQSPKQPLKLTLEECLYNALGNNYTKQSVELNEDSRQATLSQSKQERLPGVSASLSESVSDNKDAGTNWNGSYDVSASVTLFQGGQISRTIKQNKLQYEQTKLQTQQYNNELTIQVLQAFLAALGNEELLKYQEAILETSYKQVEEGKARYEAGQILESDYLLLEAQHATDLHNVTSTKISLDNSLVALKNLMAMDLSYPIELVYPDDSAMESMMRMPSQQEVVNRGMQTMPDVRISYYSVLIAEQGLKVSKSGYSPTLSLSAGVGSGHTKNFNNYGTQVNDKFTPQAGLSLSIPIFNASRTRTNVKQSRIALEQAELERNQFLSDTEKSLISEYGSVVSSGSQYRASETRQNAYNSSFQAYREMFSAGSITAVELLQQQNNYISAMNDYIQSKYTFMLQRKVLDVYMGEEITM